MSRQGRGRFWVSYQVRRGAVIVKDGRFIQCSLITHRIVPENWLFVGLPVLIVILLSQGRQLNGTRSFKGLLLYREPLPWKQYVWLVLVLLVWAVLASTLFFLLANPSGLIGLDSGLNGSTGLPWPILTLLPVVYVVQWKRNVYVSVWVHCLLNLIGSVGLAAVILI
jgi:hypothetical protein